MGLGDVKLLAGFGALMGVTRAVEVLAVASILGILVMVPYAKIAEKRAAKRLLKVRLRKIRTPPPKKTKALARFLLARSLLWPPRSCTCGATP
jgi:leader peptidase (prepilin peptidase)/N-methyltransferase